MPSVGTCLQLDFSIIFDRQQLVFQLEDVNSSWLAICCYSGVPGLSKLDLITVGKLCFHFSRVLGSVVDCISVNPSTCVALKPALRDAQNVCALTKVGTVLNDNPLAIFGRLWTASEVFRCLWESSDMFVSSLRKTQHSQDKNLTATTVTEDGKLLELTNHC